MPLKPSKFKSKRTYKLKGNKKPSKQVATVSMVKKLIHKEAENKKLAVIASALHNSSVSSTGDLLPLLPSVAQGTTQNDRVGNKTSPRGIRVAVTLSIDPFVMEASGSSAVIMPRIMVCSSRDNKDMGSLISNGGPQSYLLDDGGGVSGFTGLIRDYMAPINSEQFITHKDIRTKLSCGGIEQNDLITRTFIFWVKCPKVLDYNDSQNFPRNFAPFMYVGYAKPDNTIDIVKAPLRVTYTSTLYYEDN